VITFETGCPNRADRATRQRSARLPRSLWTDVAMTSRYADMPTCRYAKFNLRESQRVMALEYTLFISWNSCRNHQPRHCKQSTAPTLINFILQVVSSQSHMNTVSIIILFVPIRYAAYIIYIYINPLQFPSQQSETAFLKSKFSLAIPC
jgi:hypothetical protein